MAYNINNYREYTNVGITDIANLIHNCNKQVLSIFATMYGNHKALYLATNEPFLQRQHFVYRIFLSFHFITFRQWVKLSKISCCLLSVCYILVSDTFGHVMLLVYKWIDKVFQVKYTSVYCQTCYFLRFNKFSLHTLHDSNSAYCIFLQCASDCENWIFVKRTKYAVLMNMDIYIILNIRFFIFSFY